MILQRCNDYLDMMMYSNDNKRAIYDKIYITFIIALNF